MHWSSKHRGMNSLNSDNTRSYSFKNSTRKSSGNRASNGVRAGSSLGCSKPLEASSSRNLVTNENHASVLEPSSMNSKDIEGFRSNYNRALGRDIPHPSMSSRYKTNNVENIRFGVLRTNVSSSDMFQWNQSKKLSKVPPTSDRQRKINKGIGYKCKRNGNALSKGSNLSKNRNNSGARNTTYLKSHQFLRTNNHTGLQSFHNHIQHMSNPSGSNKNFNQNRKMSINQMKTVNNMESGGDSIITVDRSTNNYTSFNANKQTSFRQSYAAVNASSSNIR